MLRLILLNLFFGPVVNAAKGIASQVNNAINHFSSNFLVALFPQMIKSYSSGDREKFMQLFYYVKARLYITVLA